MLCFFQVFNVDMALTPEEKIKKVSMDGESVEQFSPTDQDKLRQSKKLDEMECNRANTQSVFKGIFGLRAKSRFYEGR